MGKTTMKTAALLLLLTLASLTSGQAFIDEEILKYLEPGEEYSTLQIVTQNAGGEVTSTNTIVLIRETPVFIISEDGRLVEDQDVILQVSQDYVATRQGTASAESIAASITSETQRRKQIAATKAASREALKLVENSQKKITTAREWLTSVNFAAIDTELAYF